MKFEKDKTARYEKYIYYTKYLLNVIFVLIHRNWEKKLIQQIVKGHMYIMRMYRTVEQFKIILLIFK